MMATAQTIGSALALTLACMAASADPAEAVRPPNAATVFDHVLVFPAGAGDQVIETWRQRASSRVQAACLESSGCRVRTFRFHVSAGWQLPMVGIAVAGKTGPLTALPAAADGPVWLAGTSVSAVRAQVAAIAMH